MLACGSGGASKLPRADGEISKSFGFLGHSESTSPVSAAEQERPRRIERNSRRGPPLSSRPSALERRGVEVLTLRPRNPSTLIREGGHSNNPNFHSTGAAAPMSGDGQLTGGEQSICFLSGGAPRAYSSCLSWWRSSWSLNWSEAEGRGLSCSPAGPCCRNRHKPLSERSSGLGYRSIPRCSRRANGPRRRNNRVPVQEHIDRRCPDAMPVLPTSSVRSHHNDLLPDRRPSDHSHHNNHSPRVERLARQLRSSRSWRRESNARAHHSSHHVMLPSRSAPIGRWRHSSH